MLLCDGTLPDMAADPRRIGSREDMMKPTKRGTRSLFKGSTFLSARFCKEYCSIISF